MLSQIFEVNSEPVIKLTGLQLKEIGFSIDDIVNISFSDNQIIISKNETTEKLQQMQRRNPSLKKLMSELNLDML